jgi:hypothetical protein
MYVSMENVSHDSRFPVPRFEPETSQIRSGIIIIIIIIIITTTTTTTTRYGLDDRRSNPNEGKDFSSPERPHQLWGPPSLLPSGYGGLLSGVKQPGLEADHSPQSSAAVKNVWSYTSNLPYAFVAWFSAKHRIRLHGVVLS